MLQSQLSVHYNHFQPWISYKPTSRALFVHFIISCIIRAFHQKRGYLSTNFNLSCISRTITTLENLIHCIFTIISAFFLFSGNSTSVTLRPAINLVESTKSCGNGSHLNGIPSVARAWPLFRGLRALHTSR